MDFFIIKTYSADVNFLIDTNLVTNEEPSCLSEKSITQKNHQGKDKSIYLDISIYQKRKKRERGGAPLS